MGVGFTPTEIQYFTLSFFTSNDFENIKNCKGNYISNILLTSDYNRRRLTANSIKNEIPFNYNAVAKSKIAQSTYLILAILVVFVCLYVIWKRKGKTIKIYAMN